MKKHLHICLVIIALFVLCLHSTASAQSSERMHSPYQLVSDRDFAFDVSVAINEYKRYYWQYPDSMESFLSFAKDYATHLWNDLSRKEKNNSTWYQTYKKLERNKQDYSIVASGGTSGNSINGVSSQNPNAEKYIQAAKKEFGEL